MKINLSLIEGFKNINLAIFLAIFFIFTLRNLDPVLFPTLYADDGGWIGLIMQKGLLFTAFNAREGFPVLGLVILDWIALQMNVYLSAENIFHLPYYVWFVSVLFLSIVSFLPIVIFKNITSFRTRLIMAFALVLMPTGSSGNEIYGRICNLGYLFPLISTYALCIYYISQKEVKFYLMSILTLFISSLTFPVCFGMLGIWLAYEVWVLYKISINGQSLSHQDIKSSAMKVLILILVLILSLYLMPSNILSYRGGADMPVKTTGWIDYVGIRLLLYPLVNGFYNHLNNFWTIILLAGFVIFSLAPFRYGVKDHQLKASSAIVLCSLIIYVASTAIMRRGFTSWFGDYGNSYPDRYFYGINALFMVSLFLTANLYQKSSRRIYIRVLAILFIVNCTISYKSIFEFNHPASQWKNFGDFKKMVCNSNQGEKANTLINEGTLSTISIYPVITEGCCWTMTLPSNVLLKSIEKECLEKAP